MKCGFCGYEFREEDAGQGCSSCPMTPACNKLKCPRCNYENPPEPSLLRKIRKLFNKSGS